jgi:RimJ/RimL family protein N-acetyltransferase
MEIITEHAGILLTPTRREDLDDVIRIEWDPSNHNYVYKWDHSQHGEIIDSDNWYHLLIVDSKTQETVGYVMLDGIKSPHDCIELTRIAIEKKGMGYGGKAIEAIQSLCFNQLNCHRLWLDVYSENTVAINLYTKKGFTFEGTLRQCKKKDGAYASMNIMSQLRPEYMDK